MRIPDEEYIHILQMMPICCVDVIVLHEKKCLLIWRKFSESFGGQWWVPGGRILKGEKWEDAVKRKVLEETGLVIRIVRKVQSYEAFGFDPKISDDVHCITTTFIVEPVNSIDIFLDKTASDYKW